MQTLKAIIIEDNVFMAQVLQDMLKSYENIFIAGLAQSGLEAKKLITQKKPDVIFLDIELPDMNGFDLLNQVKDISFKTIFTTSHSHYAIKAFRFNALDYLEKPIKEDELKEAIKRLHRTDNSNIRNALQNIDAKLEEQKLVLQTQSEQLRLLLKQITYMEGERNYSYIHLSNGQKKLSSKNLAYFENILEDKGFFRCHRSFLVNHYHIAKIKADFFEMKDGTPVAISRRKKSYAKQWYNGLLGL